MKSKTATKTATTKKPTRSKAPAQPAAPPTAPGTWFGFTVSAMDAAKLFLSAGHAEARGDTALRDDCMSRAAVLIRGIAQQL